MSRARTRSQGRPGADPAAALAVPLPLVAILTVQAILAARLLHASTAFGDEALYL